MELTGSPRRVRERDKLLSEPIRLDRRRSRRGLRIDVPNYDRSISCGLGEKERRRSYRGQANVEVLIDQAAGNELRQAVVMMTLTIPIGCAVRCVRSQQFTDKSKQSADGNFWQGKLVLMLEDTLRLFFCQGGNSVLVKMAIAMVMPQVGMTRASSASMYVGGTVPTVLY